MANINLEKLLNEYPYLNDMVKNTIFVSERNDLLLFHIKCGNNQRNRNLTELTPSHFFFYFHLHIIKPINIF